MDSCADVVNVSKVYISFLAVILKKGNIKPVRFVQVVT
jgi:hypothetical protein